MVFITSPTLQTQFLDGSKYWRNWEQRKHSLKSLRGGGVRIAKQSDVEVDFSHFTPDKYLLTWSTAVAGVEPEENGFTIVTPHTKYINDNGNAWLNELLLESYHSFILAEIFLEHVQIPELSKGKILDAVAWVIERQSNGYPEPIPTVFIDALQATDIKRHPKLVRNIREGYLKECSMGCLLPNGKVTLADGTQTEIQNIQEGDYILSPNGGARKVTKVHVRSVENEPIYKGKVGGIKNGFALTGEHPIKIAGGLKEDVRDYYDSNLLIPHQCSDPGPKADYFRVDVLKEYSKSSHFNYYVAESYPKEIWLPSEMVDEKFAELLGMLAGDGLVRDYDSWTCTNVELHLNEDEVFISDRGKYLMKAVCGGYNKYDHHERVGNVYLRNHNAKIFALLKKFLFGNKAPEKKFASEVIFWPHHLQQALLRGYFNTDGDVSKTTQLKGESRSRDLRDQVYLILLRNGNLADRGDILHKPTGFSKGKNPYMMYVVTTSRTNNASWMSDKLPTNKEMDEWKSNKCFFSQGRIMRQIDSITIENYSGLVYNLEVQDDHVYLHNGLDIHNCDVLFTQCSKCGKVFEEGRDDCCDHIRNSLGKYYTDSDGKKRKVSELCGVPGKKGSCVFRELSWVKKPAFIWASMHGLVPEGKKSSGYPLKAFVPTSRYRETSKESPDWDLALKRKY